MVLVIEDPVCIPTKNVNLLLAQTAYIVQLQIFFFTNLYYYKDLIYQLFTLTIYWYFLIYRFFNMPRQLNMPTDEVCMLEFVFYITVIPWP